MFKEKRLVFKESSDLSQYTEMAKAAISSKPTDRASGLWASTAAATEFNAGVNATAEKVTVDAGAEIAPIKENAKALLKLPSKIGHGVFSAANSVIPLGVKGVEWVRGVAIDNPINLAGTLGVLVTRRLTQAFTWPSQVALYIHKKAQSIIDKIPGATPRGE